MFISKRFEVKLLHLNDQIKQTKNIPKSL